MKKLYKKPWQEYCGFKKVGITILTLFGALHGVNAQVSSYSFAQNSGTFTSIASGGTLVTGSDATTGTTNDTSGWAVTIPFNFKFNGTDYTSIFVNSNGGASFGATTSTSSTVISGTAAYAGSVGVMNRDLWGVFITSGVTTSGSNIITNVASFKGIEIGKQLNNVNGIPTGATVTAFDETAGTITMSAAATSSSTAAVVRYGTGKVLTTTTGTAPNRVFVIEWIGYNDYGTTVAASNYLNFQLRLAESTNTVSIVYGPNYNVSTTARTNEIGLRGASNSDFNNRSGAATTAWNSTTAGTINTATVSRDNVIFPASGQTFTWSPPTCIAPSGITASSITTSAASISWTPSSTVATNGYEYYYSTSNTAPTSSTTPSGSSSTASASLSSLTAATTYYVWVRSVCSSTDTSGWSTSGTFTTPCNPVATLSENFDSYATGSIVPTCWGRIVTGSSASQTITSTTPASGTRNIYQYNNTAGQVSIVVLPELSTVNAGYQLRFKVRATAAATLDIGYLTNPTDATTFVTVQTLSVNNTSYGAESKIPFPTSVPATARVAVRMPVQTSAPSVYWDDVNWEIVPSCIEPTTVTVSAITPSGATLGWTAPAAAPANGYEYYYSTSNTAPTSSTTPSGSSTTVSANLSSLTPATTYYVWVRSVCSSTDISVWSISGTFTTACNPVATLSENFDSYATGSIVPTCWGRIVTGSSASQTITSTTPASGTRNIYQYNNTAGQVSIVVLPELSTVNAGYQLRFKVRATAAATLDVGYLTNPTDATTFVTVQTLSVNNTSYGAESKIPFPTSVPATARVAVRMPVQTSAPSVYWDDVNWEVAPSCTEPNTVTVSAVTTSGATLGWTAPITAPANGYEYYYSTSNTAPIATTVASGTSTTTTAPLSGLVSATTYYVWVRSVCSATEKSAWTAVTTFTTACNPITSFPWNENFDAMTAIGNAILPSCWTTTGGLSSSYYFTTQNAASQTYNDPRSAPNYVTIYYPTTAAYLWAPAMTLTAGQSYDFSFYWAGDATSGWVGDVLVNNAASATGATNLSNFVAQTTTTTNVYTKVTVTYVPTVTGTYHFGVKAFSATTAPYYMGFDDFNLQFTPSCAEPTSVAVNAITSSTATLGWTAPATAPANGYQYFYSTTNTAPTSGTATTATTANLTLLAPSTTYYYWVRSMCGSSNSSWVTGSFTTLAAPPANDDCSAPTAITPGATFAQNPVTGTTVGSTNTPALTAACLATPANVGGNVWYTVVVPASGSLTIETAAVTGSPLTDTVVSVFTSCSSTTSIGCDDDSGTDAFSKLTLTGQTPGATLYISVWKYSSATDGQFQVSAYDASLSTSEAAPAKNNLTVYPNPFADVLNISDVKNVKSVSVVDIAGRLVKTIDKPGSALQLGELKSGMYIVILNMNDGSKQTIKAIKK